MFPCSLITPSQRICHFTHHSQFISIPGHWFIFCYYLNCPLSERFVAASFNAFLYSSSNFSISVCLLVISLNLSSRSSDPPSVFVVLSLYSVNLAKFPWNLPMSSLFTIYLTPCFSGLQLHEACPTANLVRHWSEQLSWSLNYQFSTALSSWLLTTVK